MKRPPVFTGNSGHTYTSHLPPPADAPARSPRLRLAPSRSSPDGPTAASPARRLQAGCACAPWRRRGRAAALEQRGSFEGVRVQSRAPRVDPHQRVETLARAVSCTPPLGAPAPPPAARVLCAAPGLATAMAPAVSCASAAACYMGGQLS